MKEVLALTQGWRGVGACGGESGRGQLRKGEKKYDEIGGANGRKDILYRSNGREMGKKFDKGERGYGR